MTVPRKNPNYSHPHLVFYFNFCIYKTPNNMLTCQAPSWLPVWPAGVGVCSMRGIRKIQRPHYNAADDETGKEGLGGAHMGVDRPSCLDSPVGAGRSVAVTRTRRWGAGSTVDGRSGGFRSLGSRHLGSRHLGSRYLGSRHWMVVGTRAPVEELPYRTSRTVEAILMVAREREKAYKRGVHAETRTVLKLASAANVANGCSRRETLFYVIK